MQFVAVFFPPISRERVISFIEAEPKAAVGNAPKRRTVWWNAACGWTSVKYTSPAFIGI